MSNDFFAGAISGASIILAAFAIFQIGVNKGISIALSSLESEYPTAFRFLQKNKSVASVLPYVVGGKE